ncbi:MULTISPECIES: FAD-dependent oxidoreductase [Clostridium]|uniref:FAD-dependent oxidoreductase n=1 Tax=Clostridium aquiflavi TaxID=3073603 RepID=A0ABU1EC51_9CLOT|nr:MULTISPECIES: FAD-dependent oxidoreductase [unclassified Clostridium]MDR5585963.1 FAD-dependent oxidoreductase [Clostridium sp. 5N-1]NFG60962.1 amine oxidase [Clostridium botulinum]NFQ09453.1 amine oxidase [Clostridium botulinum]
MNAEFRYIQSLNPSNEERYKMLKTALEKSNRIEDFDDIISALAPPNDITTIASPKDCKEIKVGIIGGGLAGVSSAFELRKLGFDVTIFEMQSNRIGGRVYTHYFDKNKNFYGELGAMRIPISHESTWHYINTFNLQTRPFIQTNENAFMYIRNKRVRNDSEGKNVMEKIYPEFNLTPEEKNTSWQKLIDYALADNLLKINPSIRNELLHIKKQYSVLIQSLDNLSIRDELKKMNLSEGAIELISCVAPFLGAFYDNSYLENLQEDYSVDYAYRYEIVGGSVNLPLAFYNSLISKNPKEYTNIEKKNLGKVTLENGKTVTSIFNDNKNNKVILEYKYKNFSKNFSRSFDYVICAIPLSSLRNMNIFPMFSTEKMQAIKEVNYSSSQKTLFMCNERFWEKGNDNEKILGGGSYTDLPIQSIWYPYYNYNIKKHSKYNNYGVLLASYNLGQDAIRLGNLNNDVRFETIKRQVEKVNGLPSKYLDKIVMDFKTINWNNEPGILGAFCYFTPNQHTNFLYSMTKSEYKDKVYFAGEHASNKHGWMQGALNSGMNVANSIAQHCKEVKKY